MDIFTLLTLIGGVALFLFGMHQMGDCLEKAAGPRLESLLEKMTRDKGRALLLGIIVTAIMQSSSTTTVMVVGFVNSGVMRLSQAIPIIMGANVGTTVTSWILSLSGIDSSALWLQLLKPSSFTPVLAAVGVAMLTFSRVEKRRTLGGALAGFSILMFGMDMMTGAVKPLASDPAFQSFFLLFENPWLGMLTGAVLTGIIQSSAASIGILQALAATGGITYGMALPIIMGQNIGTCVTALISCVGANRAAKRTAMVHLYFNIIGSLLCMIPFVLVRDMVPIFAQSTTLLGIAVIHTLFNLLTTAVLLPFTGALEKLVNLTVREAKHKGEDQVLLDERLLATPTFALARCRALTARMAEMAKHSVTEALGLVDHFDEGIARRIDQAEDDVDRYEDMLGTFAVKLNNMSLSESEGRDVSRILHGIGDFERISDHAVNLTETAREIAEKQVKFTEDAEKELKVLFLAVGEILDMAVDAYNRGDVALARKVEPLEEVIDDLIDELKLRHIHRLREGRCTVETGFVFGDLLTNLERVADHCSNLAVCVIELSEGAYNAHEYIREAGHERAFADGFAQMREKYRLPQEAH